MSPAKDILEKTLEAFDDVFSDICNGLLFQGRPIITPPSLSDVQPYSFYKADGRVRSQERDVAKYWKNLTFRIALFGFENQTKVFKFMPLRVIGYDGTAYRTQLNDETDPKYPVITLVLYFGNEKWNNRNLLDCVEVPEELNPYVSDYKINVFEIAYLSEEQINYFHSDFRVLADFFVHRRTDPNYIPTDRQKFKHANEVLELLAVLTGDHRYEDIIDAEGGAPTDMCEVLDRVARKARADGSLEQAKADALNMRKLAGITDPVLVAKIVNVEAELVERWFAEA